MYSTQWMMNHTGVTMRQLTSWSSKGWLTTPSPGTGHSREWSSRDFQMTIIMLKLIEVGFMANKAHDIACQTMRKERHENGSIRIDLGNRLTLEVR